MGEILTDIYEEMVQSVEIKQSHDRSENDEHGRISFLV